MMKSKKHQNAGILELEMMLTMRNWMEDVKDEYSTMIRYQTFDFIFSLVSTYAVGIL